MGNLCGRSSSSSADNFSTPGRTVGSRPPAAPDADARAPIPNRASKPTYTSTPGRTVGGDTAPADEARGAAARAAEARAQRTSPGGKLSSQLAAQKRQTNRALLEQASRTERGTRDADAGHDARAYN